MMCIRRKYDIYVIAYVAVGNPAVFGRSNPVSQGHRRRLRQTEEQDDYIRSSNERPQVRWRHGFDSGNEV